MATAFRQIGKFTDIIVGLRILDNYETVGQTGVVFTQIQNDTHRIAVKGIQIHILLADGLVFDTALTKAFCDLQVGNFLTKRFRILET